jgi:FkbM family methyltransferase
MINIIRRPAPFVLVSSGHGTLIMNTNDYRIREDGSGYGLGYQLMKYSYYDPEEVNLAISLLNIRREFFGQGVVAFDCGANLGVHTVEWAKAMYGWGNVVAFEAQERIYYALAGNLTINNCFNGSAVHAAVGATDGELQIPMPNYLMPASFGSLELKKRERTEYIGQNIDYSDEKLAKIKLVSIDSFSCERLDFLKIDIEGMELEAVAGAEKTIERCKPIMLIEIIKTDKIKLTRILKEQGYLSYDAGMNMLFVHQSDPSLARLQVTPQT